VCDFLGIATPHDLPQLAVSFRQSDIGDPEVAAEMAWVKRVEHLAQRQAVADYDRGRLEAAVPDLLANAARAQDVNRVPAFLHGLGVHFAIVPHLAKTYLDGAAFRLNGHPVVAMTLRYDRIDNFWFTLLHELAHIVAGHEGGYLDNLDEESESPEEIEANSMARNWLIDRDALTAFVGEVNPYFSESRIRSFARSQGRHPAIVLGRLHYERLVPYQNLRKLLVPVGGHLEGWIDRAGPGA
jgi:HTH-type transcriptional regulator/antitoxin HigA